MELDETFFNFVFQILGHQLFLSYSFRRILFNRGRRVIFFTETYSMLFHLSLELLERNRTIRIDVHLLEKEFYLIFCYFRMNMLQKLRELLVVELLVPLEPKTVQQTVKVDVLGVYLEPQLPHNSFELILKIMVFFCVVVEVALEDGMQKDFIP